MSSIEEKNWNRIERPIRLADEFEVIGHSASEGETLGANGRYILKRKSDGSHFAVQALDHPVRWDA